MQHRTLAAAGLAAAGLSQVGYGLLMGGAWPWAYYQFAEGSGLLIAAAALWRGEKLPGTWLIGGLTLAALGALPWFARITTFTSLGPVASLANNTGSVVAAAAVLAWTLAALSPSAGWNGLRAGLGLQALGGVLWLVVGSPDAAWMGAYALAFVGFAAATATFPAPSAPAVAPSATATRAKAP